MLKNDIKLYFNDWKAIVLLITMPVLFIVLFTVTLAPLITKTSFVEPFDIVIVDNENTTQTRMLARQLEDIKVFKNIIRADEEQAKLMLKEDKISAAIIIPSGFTNSVANAENKPVQVFSSSDKPLEAFIVRNLMQSVSKLVAAGQSAINTIYYFNEKAGIKGQELEFQYKQSIMRFLLDTMARNEIFTDLDLLPSMTLTPAEYYTAALISVFLMFAAVPGMKLLVTERVLGISKRLKASPAGVWKVVLSKMLVSYLIAMLQMFSVILITSIFLRNYWLAPVGNIILLFSVTILAISAWSVFVSAISNSSATADVIGNLGILLMAIVGGSIYPLSLLPGSIRFLSSLTINKWVMEGFMIIFSGDNSISILPTIGPLCMIAISLLAFSTLAVKLRGAK